MDEQWNKWNDDDEADKTGLGKGDWNSGAEGFDSG